MKPLLWLFALLLLTSCLPKLEESPPESPYNQKSIALTNSGHQAMMHHRWSQAINLFQRAKIAAELADNTQLISASWYNLGMAYVGAGQHEHALRAFKYAKKNAHEIGRLRSTLAQRLLLKSQDHQWLETLKQKNKTWPIDIYLSAGRLAQQQGKHKISKKMYLKTLDYKGNDALTLSYHAKAYLGLALLSERMNTQQSYLYAMQALSLLHQLAHPLLNAHTLWLLSRVTKKTDEKMDFAQRACKIYMHLQDHQAIKRCQITGIYP